MVFNTYQKPIFRVLNVSILNSEIKHNVWMLEIICQVLTNQRQSRVLQENLFMSLKLGHSTAQNDGPNIEIINLF